MDKIKYKFKIATDSFDPYREIEKWEIKDLACVPAKSQKIHMVSEICFWDITNLTSVTEIE